MPYTRGSTITTTPPRTAGAGIVLDPLPSRRGFYEHHARVAGCRMFYALDARGAIVPGSFGIVWPECSAPEVIADVHAVLCAYDGGAKTL